MQYYKNSMRYVKFLLISVILYAVTMGIMGDKMSAFLSGQQNTVMLQQYLLENASKETQEATANGESQEEFSERILEKYRQIYPNMTAEEEEQIKEIIERKYNTQANNTPAEIKYEEPLQEQKEDYQNENNVNQDYRQMGTENMQNMEVVPDREL